MSFLNSRKSALFLITLASLLPTSFLTVRAFASTSVASQNDQNIEASSSVKFSDNTAAKLQYLNSDSQQIAKVFVQENGPSFVRKIKPFVRENGPSFVRYSQADGPNTPYVSSPASAVETFASLEKTINVG